MSTFVDFDLSSKCIDLSRFLSVSSDLLQQECAWWPDPLEGIPAQIKEDCCRSNLLSQPVQELMNILDDQPVVASDEIRPSEEVVNEGESVPTADESGIQNESSPIKLDERMAQLTNHSALHSLKPSFQRLQIDQKKRIPLNVLPKKSSQDPFVFDESVLRQDLVLTVSFFHPRRKAILSEFEVLGTQTLQDLRKAFKCMSDQYHIFSENHSASSASSDSLPLSSFFFIEGVFYSDVEPGKPDYTK
jgi:hypothetical protein